MDLHTLYSVGILGIALLFGLAACGASASDNLVNWTRSRNASISEHVFISDIPGYGLGFVANSNLGNGVTVTRTPLPSVLSLEHAYLYPEFQPIMDGRLGELSDTDLSALFVAFLKLRYTGDAGETSGDPFLDWSAYITSLPKQVGLPLQFSEDEFNEMQGSAVVDLYRRRNKAVFKSFRKIRKVLQTDHSGIMPTLMEEDFLWGLSIVWSRTHRVRAKDSSGQWQVAPALVPLADIFNMAPSEDRANVECRTDDDSRHFTCFTTQAVQQGVQLFVLYSSPQHRHNGRLLMDYGFCLLDNPWDALTFKLPSDIPSADIDYTRKHAIWESIHPWATGLLNIALPDAKEPLPVELLAVGRLINLDSESLTKLTGKSPQDLYKFLLTPSWSPAVEKASVRWAMKSLRKVFQEHRTLVSDDEMLVHSGDVSSNVRNAVILRLGEKKAILALIDALENYQQGLVAAKTRRTKKRQEEL